MDNATTDNLGTFIAKYGITCRCMRDFYHRNLEDGDVRHNDRYRRHYRAVLSCDGRRLAVPFTMGSATEGAPTTRDVLACLILDAQGANGKTFEEWANEYGYDDDSRRAEKVYNECKRTICRLCTLLGDVAWRAAVAMDVDR